MKKVVFILITSQLCLTWAGSRERVQLGDIGVGDVLEFPDQYQLEQTSLQKRYAYKTIRDEPSRSSCTISLSNSETAVTFRKETRWKVQNQKSLPATNEDCRRQAHKKVKEDYDHAISTLEDSWITESGLTRSLYKKKAAEQFLKKVDTLASSDQVCHQYFSKREIASVSGPQMLTLQNKNLQGRQLFILCNRNEVPVDILVGNGILIHPAESLQSTTTEHVRAGQSLSRKK